MDIENKDRNLYKELYKSKSDTKKHLNDASHADKMGKMDVISVEGRQKTLDSFLESGALLKNVMETQSRLGENIDEAETYASEKGYKRADTFNFVDGKEEKWYDPNTKETMSIGTILSRKTEADELKRKGISKPMDMPTSNVNFDDAMLQFKAREQLDVKFKDRKIGASEGYAKAGKKYEFKKDNNMFNYHKYDFVGILKDYDSIFGDTNTVDNVIKKDNLTWGDYETDDDGVLTSMPNAGGGGYW